MKRVSKLTSKHVENIRKDAEKITSMINKISELKNKIYNMRDSYTWTSYTDGHITDNLTIDEKYNLSDYLDIIKNTRI